MTAAAGRRAPRSLALHAALIVGLAANSPALAQEQVQIEMPAAIVVVLAGARQGSLPAHNAFPLAFHGARLGPGKALRISLRLDPSAPAGTRITFQGRSPRGGTCGSGHLSPGIFVQVFQGWAGASSGGCDLYWSVESGGEPGRAARSQVGVRWKLESVIVNPLAAVAPPSQESGPRWLPGGVAGPTSGRGSNLPSPRGGHGHTPPGPR
jgi:hypothetical protein